MTGRISKGALRLAAVSALALTLGAKVATAQDDDNLGLAEQKSMTVDLALKLAEGALASCRASGYQVAVVVVDRSGLTQVTLRDRFAGPHTNETARRKAWTAVSFRSPTLALATNVESEPKMAGLRQVTDALLLGGGVPVEAAGGIVGAVGVSGAPDPQFDDACARAGVASVSDILDFQ